MSGNVVNCHWSSENLLAEYREVAKQLAALKKELEEGGEDKEGAAPDPAREKLEERPSWMA